MWIYKTTQSIIDDNNSFRVSLDQSSPQKKLSNSAPSASSDATPAVSPKKVISRPTAAAQLVTSSERLIASRSAQDFSQLENDDTVAPLKKFSHQQPLSPSYDLELSELEKKLTKTRKSIDAKFYHSLANSQTSTQKTSRKASLPSSPEEIIRSREEIKQSREEISANASGGESRSTVGALSVKRPSDAGFPTVNERLNFLISEDSASGKSVLSATSDTGAPKILTTDLVAEAKPRSGRNSLEMAFQNPRLLPDEEEDVGPGYAFVDKVTAHSPTSIEPPRSGTPSMHPRTNTLKNELEPVKIKEQRRSSNSNVSEGSVYDNVEKARSSSYERLNDSEFERKGSLVTSKVRDVSEIVQERMLQMSPSSSIRNLNATKAIMNDIPRSNSNPEVVMDRDPSLMSSKDKAVKIRSATSSAISSAKALAYPSSPSTTESKAPLSPSSELNSDAKLDQSLTDTFAKIDAAFGFKSYKDEPKGIEASREEKKKKRKSIRRRSRHMDPPESDTSEDTEPDNRRRMSRPPRRSPIPPEGALDEKGRNKSAAEESLEAAITEFNESISDMQIPQTPKTLEYYTSSLAQVVPGNVVAKKQMFSTTTPSQTASPESLPFRDITLGVQRANREEIRTRRENLKLNDQNFNKRLSGDTIKTKPITIATARFYDRSQSCGPLSSDVSSSSTPEHTRMRSETNVSLTSPRPWSPPNTYKSRFSTKVSSPAIDIEGRDSRKRTPPLKLSIDSQESKEADDSGSSRADQLSPLPTIPASPTSRGMNSLPGRGKRKQQPGADGESCF